MTMFIPPQSRVAGTFPVVVNNVTTQLTVGQNFTDTPALLAALDSAGIIYTAERFTIVTGSPTGRIRVPGTGTGVPLAVNGVLSSILSNTWFTPTSAQRSALDNSTCNYEIEYDVVLDTTAPTYTGATAPSVAEGSTFATQLTVAAIETVTWSILTSGQDARSTDYAQFELWDGNIGGNVGTYLRFASNGVKDYEAPADANTDNVYKVVVRVADASGNNTDTLVSVTVTNVNEAVELLTNTGYADTTNWTVFNPSGASSIGSGKMQFRDDFADGDRVTQTVAAINNGVSYTVTGTISGRTHGGILIALGGTSIGSVQSANGPFSVTGVSGGSGSVAFISAGGGAHLDLDDVSCMAS